MTLAMAELSLPDQMSLVATEHPVVANADFRAAMSAMAATVCVVTAVHQGERLGRTATAVLSLAATPPSVLISIDLSSRMADFIVKSGRFSLAMLASDQAVIADAFAGKLGDADRFSFGQWSAWPSGNPWLAGSLSALDCEVIGSIDAGTHILFAGGIVEAETDEAKTPLIWQRHAYRQLDGMD